jgi:hypothetical protein
MDNEFQMGHMDTKFLKFSTDLLGLLDSWSAYTY